LKYYYELYNNFKSLFFSISSMFFVKIPKFKSFTILDGFFFEISESSIYF
jgi:hypothetical protein